MHMNVYLLIKQAKERTIVGDIMALFIWGLR
jgi:hypothetical protein